MQKLNNIPLQPKLGLFTSMQGLVKKGVTARSAAFMNMSGYPLGAHIVGRIHDNIDLSSIKTLLASIVKLRDVARLSSEVLNIIPLARIDRYQLVQGDIEEYVKVNRPIYNFNAIEDTMIPLAANLITSSEAQDSAWVLDQPTDVKENRLLMLHNLYRSLVAPNTPTLTQDKKQITIKLPNDALGTSYYVDPVTSDVKSILELPRIQDARLRTNNAIIQGASPEAITEMTDALSKTIADVSTIYNLFNMRLLDHVTMLLLDVDVWGHFISPRRSPDPSQNVERAKSLKLFSAYLESLLLFPHIASIEMFRQNYDKLQTWIVTLPPLTPHLVKNYEDTVHRYDILNARGFVANIFSHLDQKDDLLGTNLVGIPSEMTSLFGIANAEAAAATAATKSMPSANITDLSKLKQYDSVLLSQPVGTFSAIIDFTAAMMLPLVVETPLRTAESVLISVSTRFYTEEVLAKLNDMGFHIPFDFSGPFPYTKIIDGFTQAEYTNGVVHYREFTPLKSLAFERDMRRAKINTMFSSSAEIEHPTFMINQDSRAFLEKELGVHHRTLAPHDLAYGPESFKPELVKSDPELLRRLLVEMSGQSFEMIVRTIANPYLRDVWATSLSAFATMYVTPNRTKIIDKKTDGSSPNPDEIEITGFATALQAGFGMPYGMTYAALAILQGEPAAEDFLSIGDSVWIRFHKKIPNPGTVLTMATSFLQPTPYYYFAANSSTREVKEWVFTTNLWNFCLIPLHVLENPPKALLDRRFVYLNEVVYLQTNMLYTQSKNVDAGFEISIGSKEQAWQYDKVSYFTGYRKFGDYSGKGAQILTPTAEVPNEITKLIETFEKDEQKATDNSPTTALANKKDMPLPAINIVSDVKNTGRADDSGMFKGKVDMKSKGKKGKQKTNGKPDFKSKLDSIKGAKSADSDDSLTV